MVKLRLMQIDIIELLLTVFTYFIPMLFSICVHEAAHAWAAKQFGDRTAEHMGRLTLNPVAHADPIGTVLLPIAGILLPKLSGGALPIGLLGWAKPVPYNPRNLRNPRNDAFYIAAAGPASNLILAVIGSFFAAMIVMGIGVASLEPEQVRFMTHFAMMFVGVNCSLAFFNVLPFPPLDGSKMLARFLPVRWSEWLDDNQMMLGMFLLFVFMSPLRHVILYPAVQLATGLVYAWGWVFSSLGWGAL